MMRLGASLTRPSGARPARAGVVALALAACAIGAAPAPASALNPIKPICGVAGLISGIAGKACKVVQGSGKLIGAGKKLLTGHPGSALSTIFGGGGGGGQKASTVIGLAAIGAWVLGGAKAALTETANVLDRTTSPQLRTTWFSSTYWRMAGIAALLTLPFLFAAAVQALMRSDLSLLARAAFGYLPGSLLAVSVAAPLTMLLLAASDEMSAIISAAAGHAGTRFLTHAGVVFGTLSLAARSPFLVFLLGILTAGGAIVLWVEMVMREAAVYIVVLMLPLAFAALVWPARRVWAVRSIELLVALILSKFAIVAVLALGGAALGQGGAGGLGGMVTGLVLVVLGAFAPWALLRLLPLAELAAGAAGPLRGEASRALVAADAGAGRMSDWVGSVTAGMRRQADETTDVAAEPAPETGAEAELGDLAAANGASTNGASANGASANVASANGASANGASANGASADSDGANGSSAHGATADGATANGVAAETAETASTATATAETAAEQSDPLPGMRTPIVLGPEGVPGRRPDPPADSDPGPGPQPAPDPDPDPDPEPEPLPPDPDVGAP